MSRNFELLSQLGRMQELVESPVEETPVATAPAPVEEDEFPSMPPLETDGPVRDEIYKLVQSLFLGPRGLRQVVFSGAESGAGCTFTCARAAEALAAQGHGTVCVLDCNLRAPRLHQQFSTENHHGLSDALVGSDSISQYVHRLSRNLWLLSCGSAPVSAQPMLASERMRSRMAELSAAFDYVLVDAAPMNTSNDAVLLGSLSDGVVLMLKANSSRRETARKAVQELQAANVRPLGAVLNQRTFPIPEKLYKRL